MNMALYYPRSLLLLVAALLLGAMVQGLVIAPATAAESEPVSTHRNWAVHIYGEGNAKQCFITSVPTELKGDYDRNNRDQTRVYVTHGPDKGVRDIVSAFAGYRYKSQTDVTFNIDGHNFGLYGDGSFAWAADQEQDKKLVSAMKRGNTLTVTGISSRGNKTIDIYSLSGFTAAYNEIGKLCPK